MLHYVLQLLIAALNCDATDATWRLRAHHCDGVESAMSVVRILSALAVNFLEVVHSAQAVNADVAKPQ